MLCIKSANKVFSLSCFSNSSSICKGFTKNCYGVIKNRSEAIEYAIKTAKFGDIVIISGKGHEKYMLDSEGYRSFNEKSIIENTLKIRESRRLNENKA